MMFGVSALTGASTYVYAIAVTSFGLNARTAVGLTLVACTIVFALIGALIVKARPLPFAMLTLALAQLLHSVVLVTDLRPWTGGDDGLAISYEGTLFGLTQSDMSRPAAFWPICWIAFWGAIALVWTVGRSRFGEVLRAVKANEERMSFSGFDTTTPRIVAFTISGFIAAVAGLLAGFYTAFASPELLDFSAGGNALVATLIGGVGTLAGPPLGALLFRPGTGPVRRDGQSRTADGGRRGARHLPLSGRRDRFPETGCDPRFGPHSRRARRTSDRAQAMRRSLSSRPGRSIDNDIDEEG